MNSLQAWYDYCTGEGHEFEVVLRDKATGREAITDMNPAFVAGMPYQNVKFVETRKEG